MKYACIALACCLFAHYASSQEEGAHHQFDLTPDARFTVFEEPLRPDGRIDYIAALNGHFGLGVTNENNAFRELYLLMPKPDPDPEPDPAVVFFNNDWFEHTQIELMVTDKEQADAPSFVFWHDYAEQQGLFEDEVWDIESAVYDQDFDHPTIHEFVAWLDHQLLVVERIESAVRLRGYYRPLGELQAYPGLGLIDSNGGLGHMRGFARLLDYRAKYAMHLGDERVIVDSLVAIYRLAYQVSRGPMMIDSLVAISIEALANELLYEVLQSRKLRAESFDRLAEEWSQIPQLVPVAETMMLGHRAWELNAYSCLMTTDLRLDEIAWSTPNSDEFEDALAETGIDLNAGVRRLNAYMVSQAAIARASTFSELKRLNDLREQTVGSRLESVQEKYIEETGEEREERIDLGWPKPDRQALTDLSVDLFYAQFASGNQAAARTWLRLTARQAVAEAALACERHRLANGRFPEELKQLVPQYLPEIPIDSMDGEPLRYRLDPDGSAVIYTIFTNLIDDGGTTDVEDWSAVLEGDYVWRLSLPSE